jgi:glycosyltransferase involved in cell wall biosynthesis
MTPEIVFVTPWYGHFAGGAEVAARTYARELHSRGYAVEVLTTCCINPFESWWKNVLKPGVDVIDQIPVRRFTANTQGEDAYHRLNRLAIGGTRLTLQQQREMMACSIGSDSLIEYASGSVSNAVIIALPYVQGLAYALVRNLEKRVHLMPCLHDEAQSRWSTTGEMFAASKGVLYLTEAEKTVAIQAWGHKAGRRLVESPVVGLGVELDPAMQEVLKKPHGADPVLEKYQLSTPYYVYMGRKDIGKNILTLVRYFNRYLKEGGKANLVFMGGGDHQLIPDKEDFKDLGFVPEADKLKLLSLSSGLINLSANESFSIVLMEAWLCGVPVIANSECAVTSFHCRKSGGGFAVSGSDEFLRALNQLNNSRLGRKMSRQGKKYVRQNYSWNQVIDRLIRGTGLG